MTLDEFRSNKKMVAAAVDLAKHATYIEQMKVLEASTPLRLPLPPVIQGDCNHSRRLGMIEGYHMALEYLKAMAVPLEKPKEIRATFQPPEMPR